ncbi:MAG: N-acetylmuramoyl-L-alanine amidase [bacterium]|nr:N-acetylmuramoyl-L-alanine amidase [bacterium]
MKRLLIIFFALTVLASAADNTIYLSGLGKQNPIRKMTREQVDYISAADIFGALQARGRWDEKTSTFTATLSGHAIEFSKGNSFCTVDDHPYNLVHSPIFSVDDLYLPVVPISYLLSDVLERVVTYDKKRGALVASNRGYNIVGASLQEKVNGDLLEIMLTRKLEFEVFISEGNWINITIPGGLVDARDFGMDRKSEKIITTRSFQFDNAAQVSIQMRQNVVRFHTNYASDPHRIQISLENSDFLDAVSDTGEILRHDDFNPIDIIVIDAGHGGEHDGAIGRNGLREKDVTLDIALRLEKLLRDSKKVQPVLTRRDDVTVGLEDRARMANDAQGDLFVSIHANSSEERNASGSETYFLAAAKSDEARITELLENSDFEAATSDAPRKGKEELDFIIMDLLQTEYLSQSQQLAEVVQDEMRKNLNIRSRGINQAGFRVLNHVRMPSVLVEVAFISNKIEERLLGQEDFRQTAAESVFAGLMRFIERYEKEARANAGSQ